MHAIREAIAGFRRAPLLTALSATMVALALFVVGLFGVATYNLHEALSRIEDRVEVVAYLQDSANNEEIRVLEDDVMAMAEVVAVRYVSKDEAMEAARRDLPEFEDLFAGLDSNPLPASVEVELASGSRSPDVVARVAERMTLHPAVEDVRYGQEWVDRLFLLQNIGGIATLILGSAFAVVAALIIGTAIRIALFARREEIQIMRLVGATNGFIRRPFLLEGAITGLLGGTLAAAATWAAWWGVSTTVFPLAWIPWSWVLAGIGGGAAFGLLASAVSIRRHLKEL